MRLKDKVAIISGAASGIGEAVARTFAREGAKVVVADLNAEGGNRVVAEIRSAGGSAEFIRTNIARQADADAMIGCAVDKFGRLDILHNNAVGLVTGRIGEVPPEGWQKALDVGLTCYWYCSRKAIEVMMRQGSGTIVNTASVSGMGADYGIGTYNVIKTGVIALTRSIAIEYARKGIRCNCVCPGPIATPPLLKVKESRPQLFERMADAVPMGRFGQPQEIANVVLFLASDESSYVTGAAYVADGGLMAHTGLPSLTGMGPDW
jgi:meso-butanediol dehydrogenase / (S,S)-butanediol dehydrogenase / diacetyl reductase